MFISIVMVQNELLPTDIMQWYIEQRINCDECAEMLENVLLGRQDDNLLDRIATLHQGYKDSYITGREYCLELYNLMV